MHKDRAFQASSPKNFSAGPMTGLFFGRDFPYGKHASSADNQKESESGVEAAGKTGNGMAIGLGVERFGRRSPRFSPETFGILRVQRLSAGLSARRGKAFAFR
ncbi:hypothetical protein [uncultured Sphingomonas sp.]|uniref:hypothetical protein n=1 Tax=uncultured Sphingomonas sp. TaxID=158754 RepID=UPI0025CC7624|nr:hypothetical protein [uncultured Sphingomonas sp.]